MSSNVGGTDGNQPYIRKQINLAKLDDLLGQSIKGSVWAKYDLVENGGNGNEFFDVHEIFAIKNYLSSTTDVPPEVLAYFDAEISKAETEKPQTQQPVEDTPPLPQENSDQAYTRYTVQPGDTFVVIAQRLGLEGEEAQTYADELKAHLQATGQLDKKAGYVQDSQFNCRANTRKL